MAYTKGISHSKNLQFIVLHYMRGLSPSQSPPTMNVLLIKHHSQNSGSPYGDQDYSLPLVQLYYCLGHYSLPIIINITKYIGGEKDQDITVGLG